MPYREKLINLERIAAQSKDKIEKVPLKKIKKINLFV